MPPIPEITDLPRGARIVRADLHIHSCAGNHDVKDATATPEAIVATALSEGLNIIAITAHNEMTGWLRVANRNHRRPGSQSSDGRAQNHCNGPEGPDPQSLRLSP